MSSRPINVLFVCTANVCRSPLAAGLLARHAKKAGVAVNVASGSLDSEIRPIHATTVRMLDDRGIDLGRDKSRPLDRDLVSGADLVLVMTADHAKGVVGRFPTARDKTFLLAHLAAEIPPGDREGVDAWLTAVTEQPRDYSRTEEWDIADPYNESDELYLEVEAQIDAATGWLATVFATI